MLGLDTGVHGDVAELLLEGGVVHLVELCAGNGTHALFQNAQLLGDGHSGVHVVTGDHDGADTGAAALHDGVLHLGTDGVDHAGKTQEAQLLLKVCGLIGGGLSVPHALGSSQHAEGAVSHGLVGGKDLILGLLGHGQHLTILEVGGAAAQHHVGATLGILHELAIHSVDGGHHLTTGVEGSLTHTGRLSLHGGLLEAQLVGPNHQSGLGGLAGGGAVVVQHGVAAQSHGAGDVTLLSTVGIHHGHLVLGQRTGLIRADDLGAAQGLHSGETANDGAALGHVGHADGQHHGHHGCQTLGDGGHGQRNCDHEGIQCHVQRERACTPQLHAEDQHADTQHQLGEDTAELGQLALQGGLTLGGVGKSIGDLAHLGIHTGTGDDSLTAAIDHSGTHVDHVLTVTKGHVLLVFLQVNNVDELRDGDALTGEGGLFDLHAGALENAAVSRHGVAGLQHHHIAHHQILAADGNDLAVTQDFTGSCRHLLQGFDGLFCLVLLIHAQHSVQNNHEQNDDHVGEALVLHHGQHGADSSGSQQNDDHRVGQLLHELLEDGVLLGLRQLVLTVLCKANLSLSGGQTCCAGADFFKNGACFFQIMSHILLLTPSVKLREKKSPTYSNKCCT